MLLLFLLGCTSPTEPPGAPVPDAGSVSIETHEVVTIEISLDPPSVLPYEPVRCVASARDGRGAPVAASVGWERDGQPMEGLDAQLERFVIGPGESWRCVASVRYGQGLTATASAALETQPPAGDNVLILIADDLGIDNVGAYAHVPDPPPTPNIDGLAAAGVRFDNAFAYSSCSPTRAAMMTGRYGHRTGAIGLVGPGSDYELPLEEITVAEIVAASPTHAYTSSAVGKWHLGWSESGPQHPTLQGWGWFAGSRGNLNVGGTGYYRWEKWVDGQRQPTRTYATVDTTDDALARLEVMPEPWLLWAAFNAPHYPFERPPAHLHTQGPLGPDATSAQIYDAMVEALDTEIGRLLDGIAPEVLARTTVILVGDNGTPKGPTTSPMRRDRAKLTPYAGGTQVPLIVSGPRVAQPGRASDALVHVVDLFPTIAAIAGAPLADHPRALDGRSLLRQLAEPDAPGRDWLYGEMYALDEGGLVSIGMVQDHDYKLISSHELGDELYDLHRSPHHEGPELLAGGLSPGASAAYDRLLERLEQAQEALEDPGSVP